ncbi:hypothetical protein BDQ12DRAFT_581629, partial [Crucibulum laeve]
IVCKQWYRIGLPLFYESVILRTITQSNALRTTLARKPKMGLWIRRLRIDGGICGKLENITTAAPNIAVFHLSLGVASSQNPGGLCRALPLMQFSELYLHTFNGHDNRASRTLRATVLRCISTTWTRLVS